MDDIEFTSEYSEPDFIHIKESDGFPEIETNIESFPQVIGLLQMALKLFEREALKRIVMEEG